MNIYHAQCWKFGLPSRPQLLIWILLTGVILIIITRLSSALNPYTLAFLSRSSSSSWQATSSSWYAKNSGYRQKLLIAHPNALQCINWPTDRAFLGVWYSVYLCLSRRQIYLGTLHRHITFCVWEWEQPSQHCFSSCNTQTHLIIIIGRVQLKNGDLHDMDACNLTSMRI